MRNALFTLVIVLFALVASARAEDATPAPPPTAAPAAPAKPGDQPPPAPAVANEKKKKKKKDGEDEDEDEDENDEEGDDPETKKKDKHTAGKPPSLWQRAVVALQNNEQHAAAIAQRDQTIAELRQQLAAANQQNSTYLTELQELRAGCDQVEQALNALQVTPEQRAAARSGDTQAIAGAITSTAARQAVALAAGQGVPPVPALPTAPDANEAAQEAFTHAAAEPDPIKRAMLFKAASQQLMKPSGKN